MSAASGIPSKSVAGGEKVRISWAAPENVHGEGILLAPILHAQGGEHPFPKAKTGVVPCRVILLVAGAHGCGSKTASSLYVRDHFDAPASPACLRASKRCLFLFCKILIVFFFSMSAILSQFVILEIVPSLLTTMGPRWSSATPSPDPTSSLIPPAGGSGRPRGVPFFSSCSCDCVLGSDIFSFEVAE